MEAYLKELETNFTIPKSKLKELTAIFQRELEIGLKVNDGMLKNLPTYVYNLPKGSETGKYLTVDLGGTNLRIGLVQLLGSGEFKIKKDSVAIPEAFKCGSGRDIFGFIAENIEKFLEHPEIEAELPLKLGFTFSFPVQQESLAHGRILGWSKEIEGKDVIGLDAVALLQEALHSRGLDIDVEALINDTVGTLLAQIYRDPRTKMSVILGTGSNAAYIEKSSNISKINFHSSDSTVINIEWGSFGDTEDILPSTEFDLQLDSESKNPGLQKFEKMISGMYLGEIFRLILMDCFEKGILVSSKMESFSYAIKTKEMSKFHEMFSNENCENCEEKCEEIARTKFGISEVSREIIVLLSRICELISLRSCYLCAVGITAIHSHLLRTGTLSKDQLFSVALDGALYQKYPNYSTILQNLVCEMEKTDGDDAKEDVDVCAIVLVMAEDLSSVGAATAIAAQAADPFHYTLLLSTLYALISHVGYSRSAESIYSTFMATFGRGEYKKFMGKWKELKAAKSEVTKVSAQDEFAKWAKLQRKVDKLQVDFDSQYSSRQKTLLAVQFAGSIALRLIIYTSIILFAYSNSQVTVFSLDLFRREIDSVPLAGEVLAFPNGEKGQMGVFVWASMVYLSMKELFKFI